MCLLSVTGTKQLTLTLIRGDLECSRIILADTLSVTFVCHIPVHIRETDYLILFLMCPLYRDSRVQYLKPNFYVKPCVFTPVNNLVCKM